MAPQFSNRKLCLKFVTHVIEAVVSLLTPLLAHEFYYQVWSGIKNDFPNIGVTTVSERAVRGYFMSPLFSSVCPKPLLRRCPGTGPEQGACSEPNLRAGGSAFDELYKQINVQINTTKVSSSLESSWQKSCR